MFEAARLQKTVTHVKDLNLDIVQTQTKRDIFSKPKGVCTVIQNQAASQLKVHDLHFDFNSKADFNTETNSIEIATKAFNWLLNPISLN
jgi:hypothetical protein